MKILIALMLFSLHVHATELAPSALMRDLEGVYKHRFMNGIITPGKAPMEADTPYQAEDIVEIVRYDDSHIYIRAKFEFYNGHQCGISGMAGYEGGAFVFHDPESFDDGPQCTLSVRQTNKEIILTDRLTPDGVATSRAYCGARGSLSNMSMSRDSKRPIRYMERLKASREYGRAIEDLRKYESSTSSGH